jgi:BirA family transcriptional regulator, biotin operon repressor / biotin---[acetyl-CoA-carboxylase] ligase
MIIPDFYFDIIDSTMQRAREMAGEVGEDIFRVRAGHQTAGRGRRGRRWYDMPGQALMMTLSIRRRGAFDPGDENPGIIALRTGVALVEAISDLLSGNPRPMIKWPNDILLEGRKLAGILVEADPRWFFVGVGVNLFSLPGRGNTPAGWTDEGGDLQAVSLREYLEKVDADDVLSAMDEPLVRSIRGNAWRQVVEENLAWRGREVTVEVTGEGQLTLAGTVAGVGRDGALLLHGPEGIRSVYAGTVRLQDPR